MRKTHMLDQEPADPLLLHAAAARILGGPIG